MAKTPQTIPDIALLQRYRSGTCSPEEARQVDEWFEAQENEAVPPLLRRRSVQAVNRAVLRAIRSPQRKQQSGFVFLKIAAVLLLAVMAGLFGYRKLYPAKELPISYTTISTKAGERKTVILPDSTRISLNNASAIRFAENFDGKTRGVTLTGEAFFEVRHDARRPFIVSTDQLHIQVLGTSFNVKAFPGEAQAKVTVASGKVGVYSTQPKTATQMLLPGQQLTYTGRTATFSTSQVNPDDQHAWQQGILILKGENLREIARQLERWYNVKISIPATKLQQEQFNIKQNNESLNHVLASLSLSGDGFHYRIKGRQVQIW
ncbi:FecR family protein [Mucilaginibacter paludis]|uniref:Anti-FecI sigma factor, FecR n=1 Tax=Mucilaginibacter paludis DSM 18603 TaxID=714943 RepID=H1Y948_9SPHI|nr:FecR family protein [Mucilaginibacter paludis]EHQ29086.1 anti-FecI sigma factor, FecR [Mucilaginibacter paludis DSM 18603]